MKILIILLAIILSLSALSAKEYYLSFPEPTVLGSPESTLNIVGKMVNNRDSEGTYLIKLLDFYLPEGWIVSLCNPYSCMAPGITENEFNYPPADTGHLKITFYTSATPDSCEFRFQFVDKTDNNHESDTIAMKAATRKPQSVEESVPAPISVYPSIGNDIVNIKFNETILPYDFRIIDLNGKIIKGIDYIINSHGAEIDINSLASGKYLIVIIAGNKQYFASFVRN